MWNTNQVAEHQFDDLLTMNCSHWTLKDGSDITMPARKMDCPAILGAEVFLAVGTSGGLSFPP